MDLHNLIGNPNAYAVQKADGSWVPIRQSLDALVLERHRAGQDTIGTYIVHGTKARTLVFDIDSGFPTANDEAQAIVEALGELGLPKSAIGTEESGRKGLHVWVVFQGYVPARDLRRLGLAALAMAGVKAEVFPKQDEARDLGNLVKLPEGKHRVTDNWSKWIANGGRSPRPLPVKLLERVLQDVPEVHAPSGAGPPPAFPCMMHAQAGVEEGGRNRWLFHLAVMLRRGGLNDENTSLVVHRAAAASRPPLDAGEVEAVLDSSRHSGPLCRQLEGEAGHCGEACILRRVEGLRTRPGQVRSAAAGERVVVTVGERRPNNVIAVEHDDIEQGRAVLK